MTRSWKREKVNVQVGSQAIAHAWLQAYKMVLKKSWFVIAKQGKASVIQGEGFWVYEI